MAEKIHWSLSERVLVHRRALELLSSPKWAATFLREQNRVPSRPGAYAAMIAALYVAAQNTGLGIPPRGRSGLLPQTSTALGTKSKDTLIHTHARELVYRIQEAYQRINVTVGPHPWQKSWDKAAKQWQASSGVDDVAVETVVPVRTAASGKEAIADATIHLAILKAREHARVCEEFAKSMEALLFNKGADNETD